MKEARHHEILYPFARYYTGYRLGRHFRSVEYIGERTETGLSVLLLSNHVSWWDGLWNFRFVTQVLKRRFYFMSGERQLEEHPFLNRIGGFSVRRDAAGARESLRYAADLLTASRNAVLIYPQGEIGSVYEDRIRFRRGAAFLLQRLPEAVELLMMAYFTENGNRSRPLVRGYFVSCNGIVGENLEEEYLAFYRESREKHIQSLER